MSERPDRVRAGRRPSSEQGVGVLGRLGSVPAPRTCPAPSSPRSTKSSPTSLCAPSRKSDTAASSSAHPLRAGCVRWTECRKSFEGRTCSSQNRFSSRILCLKEQWRNEFRVRSDLQQQVEDTVRRVGGAGRVRVGVHVRRTDYKSYLRSKFNTTLVGPQYFKVRFKLLKWF